METSSSLTTSFVSIAMATYNGSRFIAEQLDAILSQTFSNFELIIVDDFSTDDTRAILNSYQQTDKRIQLFFNEENTGYQQTFYEALKHCSGRYILFCDQDDIWMEKKIETLLNSIEGNLLIFSDSELIDEAGNHMNVKLSDTVRMQQPGDPQTNRGFVIGNCVWGHTIMFHASLLNYTTPGNNAHPHDWWFAVVSSHLNKIKYCPAVLNYYRQHGSNVTRAIPVKAAKVPGAKHAEFNLQLSRIDSIANLAFNTDQVFYKQWQQLFMKRKNGFSISLFRFLYVHRKEIFSFKRKNIMTQIIEMRKMCRSVD